MERAWMWVVACAASCGCLALLTVGSASADDPPERGSATDLVGLGEKLFDVADVDGDGRVSKAEAIGTASFFLGGLIVRADNEYKATVAPTDVAETLQVPMTKPLIAEVVGALRGASGQSPVQPIGRLLDVERGKPVSIKEARIAALRSVDALFATADTNHDGALSRDEVRAAAQHTSTAASAGSVSAADTNHDGVIDRAELEAAAAGPIREIFDKADADGDGKLSPAEAATAMRLLDELAARRAPHPEPSSPAIPKRVEPTAPSGPPQR